MNYFVEKGSIVRDIWGKGDTIIFIFGGAAAEFALNKAVDWLYFTGKLPADPLRRLLSTVRYAREIVFSEEDAALRAIDKITSIHAAVEAGRGAKIPDWAYRDVLFMLIHYSIAAYELLERKLTASEKEEVFQVFFRMGLRMNIPGLPTNYRDWLPVRKVHLEENLEKSKYSIDLYRQYRKHLGLFRYKLLVEGQKLVVPEQVKKLLNFGNTSMITPLLFTYKLSRKVHLDRLLKAAVLPPDYRKDIMDFDINPAEKG
ncbi:DUF2236 domain-containing protein [Segetibacter sp. 3557_3]|uniref:oxygenase MpaB family protein n=1 Tax=Segetibacter sp. 3557_3 TaxID=2547429 RepID=UPI0010587B1B|nr:oxygenase MpaB family protein [Segetibacter sp. 3557_3]TDH27956.1 DUF2236 domain-containing protein [Segetibacter sp. 3557_3]